MPNIDALLETVLEKIESLCAPHLLIAIDGRCASGKTTLAMRLADVLRANVIHMDHFFLPPELRTPERLSQPGGNVHYERFLHEVLEPLEKALLFSYQPYDCGNQRLGESIQIQPRRVNIVEGTYSCHALFASRYHLRVFMSIDKAEQLRRVKERNGEAAVPDFVQKWIPLEERYFEFSQINNLAAEPRGMLFS